jgi:REP element-mobilizing transposase RayT
VREQLPLFKQRGGTRRGAGRPPKGARAGERHKARPVHQARHPVHVVLRVVGAVGSLRRRRAYQAIRRATLTAARRDGMRIVHLSLQRTHIHLLVEARDKQALASGMQGFQISAAKHLNAAISQGRPGPRRRGKVFPDRYHATVITAPRQARHALSYILNNWRKQRGHARLVDRLVLERGDVPGLAGVRRRGVPVARPTDLRSALGLPAQDVAAARGVEEVRPDLLPRCSLDAAVTSSTPGGLALRRERWCHGRSVDPP